MTRMRVRRSLEDLLEFEVGGESPKGEGNVYHHFPLISTYERDRENA